ncbi:MAG: site-specific integrase [Bacteroidota bacterium]
MATVSAVIRKSKKKKNETIPIYIRLTVARKHKYISLGQSVHERDWNRARQRVRKSHPNSHLLNRLIVEKLTEVEGLAMESELEHKPLGQMNLRSALERGSDCDVIEYALMVHQRLSSQRRYNTMHMYKYQLRCFQRFLEQKMQRKTVAFNEFNRELMLQYRQYCEADLNNSKSTVRLKIGHLKVIIKQAIEDGIVSDEFNPFRGIRLQRSKSKRVVPSVEEVDWLRNFAPPAGELGYHARNMYLFSATMAGIRFSDVVQLRWMDIVGGRLSWRTQKTRDQKALYLPKEPLQILESYRTGSELPVDYIFPLLQGADLSDRDGFGLLMRYCNSQVNRALRELWQSVGASRHYTFHTARHFFATDSLRKGMRVAVLKEIMTHASIDQTLAYARVESSAMDEAMRAYEMARSD